MRSSGLAVVCAVVASLGACGSDGSGSEPTGTTHEDTSSPPYPPSAVFETIEWDFNITRLAGGSESNGSWLDGSDLWAMTWDSNGDLYGAWGDGQGFGETVADSASEANKVFMGVSRITGQPLPAEFGANPTATNVWGGIGTHETPNRYTDGTPALGKGNALFSVKDDEGNDVLVLNVAVQNAGRAFTGSLIAYSFDAAKTWTKIPGTGDFQACGGLMFGPGSTGTPANVAGYTYGYADQGNATGTLLCREPKSHFSKANIANLGSHAAGVEWFTGLDSHDNPTWGTLTNARGVIQDTRTEDTIVTYDPAVARYIAVYEFNRPTSGDDTPMGPLAVLDAPNPWGPWTTVGYYQNWGGAAFTPAIYNLSTTILPNWFGPVTGGKQSFCAVFSGVHAFDSFNLLCNNQLVLRPHATPPPPPPPPPPEPPPGPPQAAELVTIDSVSTGRVYMTTEAAVGALLYSDRTYAISTLSPALAGGVLIQTANSDKDQKGAAVLTFTLSQAAVVSVAYDDAHISGLPAWLSGWDLEPEDSLVSETFLGSYAPRVYSKAFSAGRVVLGGNAEAPAVVPSDGTSMSNYLVIAKR